MIEFHIPDLSCQHCVNTITQAVKGIDKQAELRFDMPAKKVTIASSVSLGELAEAIKNTGYGAESIAPADATCCGVCHGHAVDQIA